MATTAKPRILIVLTCWVMLALLCACGGKGRGGDVSRNVSPALANIDSMMWRQPDSAFLRLQEFAGSPEADSLSEFDGHYFQLLLSELLYKNDYSQSNREELLRAVVYFDSLENEKPFLVARAHYIKGVGYYETDSVVEACGEYLKALEIMEGNYNEMELIGMKATLAAISSTHLEQLYSDFYLHEQALYFGELALGYYNMYDAEPWHVAWVLDEIGMQYDMMDMNDSADFYYHKGLLTLPDTNNLAYRDIKTHLAYLSYKKDDSHETALRQLYILANLSESEREKLTRQSLIGEIYYRDALLDSAWLYLNKVYVGTNNVSTKKQVAEWLVEICKTQGKNLESFEYASFLVPFANLEENQSAVKSSLSKLYKDYAMTRTERRHRMEKNKAMKVSYVILGGLLTVMLIISVVYCFNKTKKKRLEAQIIEERYSHETQQKALSGKLKKSNEALLEKTKELKLLSEQVSFEKPRKEKDYNSYLENPICRDILTTVDNGRFKSKIDFSVYKKHALQKNQIQALRAAADETMGDFTVRIKKRFPKLTDEDVTYCCLYLLGISEADISALMQKAYPTVCERRRKIKRIIGEPDNMVVALQKI